MPDPARPNAVERRLAYLLERWDAFASEPTPRLLCWTASADDAPVIDTFLGLQCDGRGAAAGCEAADCFVRLDAPFTDAAAHGDTLVAALAAHYAAARADLAAAGHAAAWTAPPPRPGGDDVGRFAAACASFQAAHADLGSALAVVLAPEAVADDAAWAAWLVRLARAAVPASVRFVVVDAAESPRLGALGEAEPVRVRAEPLALDMAGARLELARAADKGDAGSAFRLEYLALTTAAGRGDLPAVHGGAVRALAIARREGWPAMEVAVHLAAAAAALAVGGADDAVDSSRAAAAAADAAARAGDPAGPTLVLQSRLGEGGALVSAARWAEAAAAYEGAAGSAVESGGNALLALEGWRMASWCHAQLGDVPAAWRTGWAALDVGEALDPAWRSASTLPLAGRALVDLARQHGWPEGAHAAEWRLAGLLREAPDGPFGAAAPAAEVAAA